MACSFGRDFNIAVRKCPRKTKENEKQLRNQSEKKRGGVAFLYTYTE